MRKPKNGWLAGPRWRNEATSATPSPNPSPSPNPRRTLDSPVAKPVAVIGAGSWGTTLAQLLGDKGVGVRLWVREAQVLEDLHRDRINHTFLPEVRLSSRISYTQEFGAALEDAGVVIMAVPSHVFRQTLRALKPHWPQGGALLSATKGMEIDSQLTMDGVTREELGAAVPYAVLAGARFAREVIQKQPTAGPAASRR